MRELFSVILVMGACGAPSSSHAADTVRAAFPPPAGSARVPGDAFGAWLGQLELEDPAVPVRTHDGRHVGHRARVVRLARVDGDLQQCADTLIRLRAEWLRSTGQPVSFHATSGDPLPWARVAGGEQPVERGGRIVWRPGGGSWERYLSWVFTWAGTASLAAHDTRPTTALRPGAVLVDPGFPGHAVQVLDVATDGARTWVLVGEGFMPAQDFHVELGPEGGWWRWEDGLAMSTWTFAAGDLRAWR